MSEYLKSNMQPGMVVSVAHFSNLIVENWASLSLPEITVREGAIRGQRRAVVVVPSSHLVRSAVISF